MKATQTVRAVPAARPARRPRAAGKAGTRRSYDPYRGWLASKDYADSATGLPPATPATTGPIYAYTPAGRLLFKARPGGLTNSYDYTHAGDPLSESAWRWTGPANTLVSYTYDRQGRRATASLGDTTASWTYNDANQMLTESYIGGILDQISVNNTYDDYLRRTVVEARNGPTVLQGAGYFYDAASRLQVVTNRSSVTPSSATYTYENSSFLIKTLTFQENGNTRLVTTKQFDRLNRLTSISSVASGTAAPTLPITFAYTYNSANQRTRATTEDGSFWVYSYDDLGQVTSGRKYWSDGTEVAGQQFDYNFDTIGNRTTTGGRASAQSQYGANRMNQYTNRTVAGVIDVTGIANPTASVTVNGNTANRHGEYFQYPLTVDNSASPVNPLVTVISQYGARQTNSGNVFVAQTPEAFVHDGDGNLLSDGRWNYTWDDQGRLATMAAATTVGPQISLRFDYDWQGRRIRKQVWANTNWFGSPTSDTRFIYDGWNLVAEVDGSYNLLRSYIWGLDLSGSLQGAGGVGGLLLISEISNGQISNSHAPAFDGNGNVSALISTATGAISARYTYGPFGEVVRATGPFAKLNPFRFSTKYQDDETEQLYYGYRYYNASTGRWVSRDPAAELDLNQPSGDPTAFPADYAGERPAGYDVVANDALNANDYLGLLIFGNNVCQGCNAGGPYQGWGYHHSPAQSCYADPRGTSVPGPMGAFSHYCYGNPVMWGGRNLCNTETHIKINALNLDCCAKWLVTCSFTYNSTVSGSIYARETLNASFLGRAVFTRGEATAWSPQGNSPRSGPYSIHMALSRTLSAVVTIGKYGRKEIASMSGSIRAQGLPNLISEGGTVSCSAACAESGPVLVSN
jgi:RHS repeat-associated protein